MGEYEIVEVPQNSSCPKEYVRVQDPRTDEWKPVVILYDTGASLTTATMDLIPYDHRSIPAVTSEMCLAGINATEHGVRYDNIIIKLQTGEVSASISVNCKQQPKTPPPLQCDLHEWKGVTQTSCEEGVQPEALPLIVLASDASHWHPRDIDLPLVPNVIRERYPGYSWKKSRITGHVIPWGRERVEHPPPQVYEGRRVEAVKQQPGIEAYRQDGSFCSPLTMDESLQAENHRAIITEIRQLVVPAKLSSQIGNNKNLGCWSCDVYTPWIFKRKEDASFLTKQLKWEPWGKDPGKGGHFVLDRTLSEKARHFPPGIDSVRKRFLGQARRLERQPHTAQFLNWRLEIEFLLGYFKKYSPEELQEALHRTKVVPSTGIYLHLGYVHNMNSSSTPARILVDPSPARPLQEPYRGTKLSYNQLISVPNYVLITPLDFSLLQTFLPVLVGADIKTAFRAIAFSEATTLQNLTLFYVGKDGQPLVTPEMARRDSQGQPLIGVYGFNNMLFGQTDAPSILGIALTQCVRQWVTHGPKENIPPHFIKAVEWILEDPYVDDLNIGQPLWRYIEHAIKRCPECKWCPPCIDRVTGTTQSHPDDCRLWSSIETTPWNWDCCTICPDCAQWQKWLRPHPLGYFDMTSEDWSLYLQWLSDLIEEYLQLLVKYLLTILRFSGFACKSVDSNLSKVRKAFDDFKATLPEDDVVQSTLTPKPDIQRIHQEALEAKKQKNTLDLELDLVQRDEAKPFLVQMAKEFYASPDVLFKDTMKIKTRHLEVNGLKGGYANSGPMTSYDRFLAYMKAHHHRLTRRLGVSLLGTFYDPTQVSNALIIAVILAKSALYHMYNVPVQLPEDKVKNPRATLPDWDVEVRKESKKRFEKAAEAFFLFKEAAIPRSNQLLHPNAGHLLVPMCDASVELGAIVIFVVSFGWIDGKYVAKVQTAARQVLSTRPDWLSMPGKESHFLFQALLLMAKVIPGLEKAGIDIHPRHVAIVTDSITSLIHVRSSVLREFRKAFGHMTAKMQSILYNLDMDPIENCYFFDQKNDRKIPFPADKISKIKPEITSDGMMKLQEEIGDLSWMEEHPSTWPISRGIVGRLDVTQTGRDLELDPAAVTRIQGEMIAHAHIGGKVAQPMDQTERNWQEQENRRAECLVQEARGESLAKCSRSESLTTQQDHLSMFDRLCLRFHKAVDRHPPPRGHRTWRQGASVTGVLGIVIFFVQKLRMKVHRKQHNLQNAPATSMSQKYIEWGNPKICRNVLCSRTHKYPSGEGEARPHLRVTLGNLHITPCGAQGCIVCDLPPQHRPSTTDIFNSILTRREPCDPSKHLEFTRKQVWDLAHFPWNEMFKEILENRALDIICSVYPETRTRQGGWDIHSVCWGNSHRLTTTQGRIVRDTSQLAPRVLGRPYYRAINNNSHFAVLLTEQIHYITHHKAAASAQHLIQELGIKIADFTRMMQQQQADCLKCHCDRVLKGNPSRLLKRNRRGPIDIGTISELNDSSLSSYWICDTVGPLNVSCPAGTLHCSYTIHIAVYVQMYTNRVLFFHIKDISVDSIFQTLVKLVSTEGRVDLLITDPAASFKSVATEVGPIEARDDHEAIEILEKLSERSGDTAWRRLLLKNYTKGKLNKGIRIRISPTNQSNLQGKAEKMVEKLKLFLTPERVFHMTSTPQLNIYQIDSMLSMIMHTVNNLPMHRLSETCFFSPNDLLAAGGRIALNKTFPSPFDPEQGSTPKLFQAINLMEQMAGRIRTAAFAFFLPLLRDGPADLGKCDPRSGEGRTIDELTKGSIVCDYKKVKNSHTFQGSLARVEAMGKGRRWCVISGVKQKALNSCSSRYKQILRECTTHRKRACMKCLKEGLRRDTQKRKKKLDKVPMDIRIRRTDELFLIHREPTEEDRKANKGEGNKDSLQAEQERREEASVRRKQTRTPEKPEGMDQRWVVPPLEREDVRQIVGEYILPTEAAEVKAAKEAFEKELEQTNQDLDQLLEPPEMVPWLTANEPGKNDQPNQVKTGLKRADRRRARPERFQAGQ